MTNREFLYLNFIYKMRLAKLFYGSNNMVHDEQPLKPPWCHHYSALPWWVGCRSESRRSSLSLCRRVSRLDPQNLTTVGVKGGNAEAGKGAKRGREEDKEMRR
ncbi:hypothetical protein AAZX31_04G098400 [Glycine max]